MQIDSGSCLNRMENVNTSVSAGNQPGWIQAVSSEVPSVGFSFNVSSVFKSFASYSDQSCVCAIYCLVWDQKAPEFRSQSLGYAIQS